MARESALEKKFVARVKEIGGLAVKHPPPPAGFPDRIVFYDGAVYLVELKTNTGVLSKIQRYYHKVLARVGIDVVVLYGWEEMNDWITRLSEGRC